MENTSIKSKTPLMDLRQTKEYAGFLNKIGWTAIKENDTYYYIKTLPLVGSAIKLQRTKPNIEALNKLAKKHRAFLLIVEPEKLNKTEKESLTKNGFKISPNPYLPTKTLQIDITNKKENILLQMKKDARYALRKSEKIKVCEEKSIEKFRSDWKNVVGNKRHVLPINELYAFKKAFGKNMLLLQNKEGTAGGMFLTTKDITYYWIGFTSDTARKSLVQYKIIWEGLLWGKNKKAKIFDFEGIYDERFPIKGWQGFTHFKKSFGGYEINYPGCFLKWRLPL